MDIIFIYDFVPEIERESSDDEWFEISYEPYKREEDQYYRIHNLESFFSLLEESFEVREIEEGVLFFLKDRINQNKARLKKLDAAPNNDLLVKINLKGGYEHQGSYECWDAIVLDHDEVINFST